MKRRSYRKLKARANTEFHHNVYVVLLAAEAVTDPRVLRANPARKPSESSKPCVYVGMTGLSPEERFLNHKQGIKAARIVQKYGIRLLPELYTCFNPMPFEAAAQMEKDLAEDLRQQGYVVAGGH